MEKLAKLESIQPRFLKYRSHYKIYLFVLLTLSALVLCYWGYRLNQENWQLVFNENSWEMYGSLFYFASAGSFYYFWLRSRMGRSVQVFPTYLKLHNHGKSFDLHFESVESVGVVCWSVFYFKMKDGRKHYFSASLERIDYVWEGFYQARPDIMSAEEFNSFRTKLVQYDHHQKRKEWFFRHKLVDVFNWIVLPTAFLTTTYFLQSEEIVINQKGMYFFRLCMYSALVLMMTTFLYSFVLKKFIFDRRVKIQMNSQPEDKLRDIEFEGIVLHRSKLLQMITAMFLFALVIRSDLNLYSVTKIKEDLASFKLQAGKTHLVDNRYNCSLCKFPVKDGDLVVFGKGTIGQIMASQGDMVGQISQDRTGRIIASENIQEVPKGFVAVKLSNQNEIVMVKLDELIGKLQK